MAHPEIKSTEVPSLLPPSEAGVAFGIKKAIGRLVSSLRSTNPSLKGTTEVASAATVAAAAILSPIGETQRNLSTDPDIKKDSAAIRTDNVQPQDKIKGMLAKHGFGGVRVAFAQGAPEIVNDNGENVPNEPNVPQVEIAGLMVDGQGKVIRGGEDRIVEIEIPPVQSIVSGLPEESGTQPSEAVLSASTDNQEPASPRLVSLPEFPGMQFKVEDEERGATSWSFKVAIVDGKAPVSIHVTKRDAYTELVKKYLPKQGLNEVEVVWLPTGTVEANGNRMGIISINLTLGESDQALSGLIRRAIDKKDTKLMVYFALYDKQQAAMINASPLRQFNNDRSLASTVVENGLDRGTAAGQNGYWPADDLAEFDDHRGLTGNPGIRFSVLP